MIRRGLLSFVLLLVIVSGSAFAQSWNSALTEGLTAVQFTKVGTEYTMVLQNLTSLPGDTRPDFDVLVWALEPFNVPAPETILESPEGWVWDGAVWKMFEIADETQKYYTPPALAPGGTMTFRYVSTLTDPANHGGPADGSPGFLAHVAAVDPLAPGPTQKWTAVVPEGFNTPTWNDHSVPEPGSLLALSTGLIGAVGLILRKRRNSA